MALTDKNIIITPNKGSTSTSPTIKFVGADTSNSATILLSMVNFGTVGTMNISGTSTQLFSITDSMTGVHFSVNNAAGIPNIEITDAGLITLAQYTGYVSIASTVTSTSTTTGALVVTGGIGVGGNIYFGGNLYQSGVLFTGGGSSTGTTSTFVINNATSSTTTATGALQVLNGGVGIGGSVNVGGTITTTGAGGGISGPQFIYISGTTASTSSITGALTVAGGVGVSGSIYAGPIYSNGYLLSTSSAAVAVLDDVSTDATYYPQLSTITTGTLAISRTSSTKLYYNPNSGTLNSTTFNSLSDEREKTNISIISNGLEIVENLRGVTFEWLDDSGPSAGLIAQDVERWLPQLVGQNTDGVKNLNYSGIIGVLVEAVKTLSDRVKALESK